MKSKAGNQIHQHLKLPKFVFGRSFPFPSTELNMYIHIYIYIYIYMHTHTYRETYTHNIYCIYEGHLKNSKLHPESRIIGEHFL